MKEGGRNKNYESRKEDESRNFRDDQRAQNPGTCTGSTEVTQWFCFFKWLSLKRNSRVVVNCIDWCGKKDLTKEESRQTSTVRRLNRPEQEAPEKTRV